MKKVYKKLESMRENLKKKMGIDFNKEKSIDLEFKRSEMRELELLLSSSGKEIRLKDIKKSRNGTFTYKGKNVILYIRDQYVPQRNPYKFHIAWCDILQSKEDNGEIARYVVTNRRDGLFVINEINAETRVLESKNIEKKMEVCVNCLEHLKYKGFRFNQKTYKSAVEDFRLKEFFEKYETKFNYKDLDLSQAKIAVLNEYPENWADISRNYRESKSWICEDCGKDLKEDRSKLETHHIDRNKANCRISNLKALCKSCHEKTHNV